MHVTACFEEPALVSLWYIMIVSRLRHLAECVGLSPLHPIPQELTSVPLREPNAIKISRALSQGRRISLRFIPRAA
jgi:hypothetical protein